MSKKNTENVLALFGEHIGLSNLRFSEVGECVLQFDELVVQLLCDEDWLKALIVLNDENEVPASLMAQMLDENFYAVHAYSLARTPLGQAALLGALPTVSLNFTIFAQWVEEALKVATEWHLRLRTPTPDYSEVQRVDTSDILVV